ncbi:MAG: septal ring lytic transglycosylase RlpA family protein [Burkholderiaceae bacterium]|nr:septal ring lytic transglycosylase RlpA family protein [Burkholderiaceae bacterium]
MGLRRRLALGALVAGALLLAACSAPRGPQGSASYPRSASAPPTAKPAPPPGARSSGGGYYRDDGPGDSPPPDLASIPDALPWNEPVRERNSRPYVVFGREYVPMRELAPFHERGIASWYGRRFHGMPTATGEPYDMYAMTAAHPTLPLPSYARVTSVADGRSVVVRVNDRGPFLRGRAMDLSYAAAARLGFIERGSGEVEIELLQVPDISSPPPSTPRSPTSAPAAPAPSQLVAMAPMAEGPGIPIEVSAGAAGIYLQLGAFSSLESARSVETRLEREIDWLADRLVVRAEMSLFKVQAGPWAARPEAQAAAERILRETGVRSFAVNR